MEPLAISSSAFRDALGLGFDRAGIAEVVQGEMKMHAQMTQLPASMTSRKTGEILHRGVRPFTVTYKGQSITIDLPGYYPAGEGDGVHVGNDMAAADAALRTLKERIDGVPTPATIRRIRAKLKLSQRAAGAIFKVGPNAFDKYERGLIEPSGPTIQLISLLDRHPELIADLQGETK